MDELYQRLQGTCSDVLDRFELLARGTAFHVPPALLADMEKQPEEAPMEVTDAMDQEADRELDDLRSQVVASRAACRQMRTELAALDRELRACGEAQELQQVAVSAKAGGSSLAEDAAAVAGAALRLQPLLARAERLRLSLGGSGGGSARTGAPAAIDRELQK